MPYSIKNRTSVVVFTEPDDAPRIAKAAGEMFVSRAQMGGAVIVEAQISRLGDVATMKGVRDMAEGAVPNDIIEKLDPEAQRLATLWNWKLKASAPRQLVEEQEVTEVMEALELRVEESIVRDLRTGEELGKIQDGEIEEDSRFSSPNPGCFWLRQRNSWRVIPGFFGAWTRARGSSETRACTSSGGMSSNRQQVDYIRVSVWNQVGAYAWRSRYNASFVDGEDWEYVWIWEVEAGGARTDSDHYARWDGDRIRCSL